MLAGWLYFVLYRQVTGSTAGQDKCAEKFECGATPFKRMITGKWQEDSKRKEEPKGTSKVKKVRKSKRLEDLAKQEWTGAKGTLTKKARLDKPKDDNDNNKEDN